MNPSLGLSHGEIVVAAGLIAMLALAVASVIGFTVAYLATREPTRAAATAASPAAPRAAVAGPADYRPAARRQGVAVG